MKKKLIMKEKWEKPLINILSLRNTQTPGEKARDDTYEATRVKNGAITTSTSS